MKVSSSEPGIVLSASVHAALLAVTLIAFTDARRFDDAQESVPVDIVTDAQFNEIMKGEKDAKQAAPTPTKADKQSEVEEKRPTPKVEAKQDIPTPPPPLKRIPDPGDSDVPEPPKKVAALPPEPPKVEPPKPEPPKPPARPVEAPKAEAKPEPPKPDAEAIEPPKPPQRPKEEPKKAEAPTPPAPPAKPKQEPQLDRMAVAKLLEKSDAKPAARPKSGDETVTTKTRFNADAVSNLLSHEPPGQRAPTARAVSQQASLGSPTANAAKMSPSMWGQLDGLLQEQYKQCWSYIGLASTRYIPQIKVAYSPDGSLTAEPQLLNAPSDPNLRSLSESAMRAVRRCNPLRIPAQFAPYYEQWKSRILRFDPEEMAG